MGKNKFRLSDMIPNAWFYKLKDVGMMRGNNSTVRKKPPPPSSPKRHHYPRKSYYFTRDLIPTGDRDHTNPDPPPPTKSSKQRVAVNRRTTTSSVSAGCSCRASFWTNSDSPPRDFSASPSDTSSQELFCSDSSPPAFRSDRILAITNDVIVMNVDNKSLQSTEISHLHLPPIITKPPSKCSKKGLEEEEEGIMKKKINVIKSPTTKNIRRRRKEVTEDAAASTYRSLSEKQSIVSTIKEQSKNITTSSVRRNNIYSVISPRGIRLRVNSPRIVSRRKSNGRSSISSNCSSSSLSRNSRGGRRSLSDSLAIVKSSFNPQKDFRESMVEMIVENDIKCSKELEDLLACYLSLNADEYHDLIIMVFKQLWIDLTHITRTNNNNN